VCVCVMFVHRLVAEIPPTSGVMTTPDVLVVKLVPDVTGLSSNVYICQYVVLGLTAVYILMELVGVRITHPHALSYDPPRTVCVCVCVCVCVAFWHRRLDVAAQSTFGKKDILPEN